MFIASHESTFRAPDGCYMMAAFRVLCVFRAVPLMSLSARDSMISRVISVARAPLPRPRPLPCMGRGYAHATYLSLPLLALRYPAP
jgi:hypothetical protein